MADIVSVTLNKESLVLQQGMSEVLYYGIRPKDVVYNIEWLSEDTNIATVDEEGKVTAINVGTTNITLRVSNETETKEAVCRVEVIEAVTHETNEEVIYEHTPSSKQVFYDGNYVTCYPGSNQTDNGKLNMEFNMARIVTRVTSKNFCIVEPSFELSKATDTAGKPMLKVAKGQACINGMDLIIDESNRIYPPDDSGDYYIALHLWRDSSSNVLGDLTVGINKQFKGVYLDWWDNKYAEDKDCLWLGKVHWDGTTFTSIEEDLDKYGRIWAEDILCKMEDWKHPNTTRIKLQNWLYKVPDWYVSKEGDLIFGDLEFRKGRTIEEGILDNHEELGDSDRYGIKLKIDDNNKSNLILKPIDKATEDTKYKYTVNVSNTGVDSYLGQTHIYSSAINNYDYNIEHPNNIKIKGDSSVSLQTVSNTDSDALTTLDIFGNTARIQSTLNPTLDNISAIFSKERVQAYFGNGVAFETNGTDIQKNISGNETVNVNNGNGTVQYNTSEFRVSGDITAKRVWNAVYNGFGEIFEKDPKEIIEYGDIVCIKEDGLVHKLSSVEDIKRIIGICSNTVGIGLGGENIPKERQIEVEMIGQVWIKTDDTTIKPGDMVRVLPNAKVEKTLDVREKVGIAETKTIDNKVRVVIR